MNTNNLKNALRDTDWTSVYVDNDVDSSFNTFWAIFKALYDEHFPLTNIKFNINKHKLNGYMTNELLESRNKKINLYKRYLSTPANYRNKGFYTGRLPKNEESRGIFILSSKEL